MSKYFSFMHFLLSFSIGSLFFPTKIHVFNGWNWFFSNRFFSAYPFTFQVLWVQFFKKDFSPSVSNESSWWIEGETECWFQVENSHVILTGAHALNKLLGKEVYTSNNQLGGPQIMFANGVSHVTVPNDFEGIFNILTWLSFMPKVRDVFCKPFLCHGFSVNLLVWLIVFWCFVSAGKGQYIAHHGAHWSGGPRSGLCADESALRSALVSLRETWWDGVWVLV